MQMADNLIEITESTFDTIIKENPKIVVDFWADWCGPCRAMGPVFEKLAKDYSGKVMFGKVNCDKNQKLVTRYKVLAIPTILFFKDGEVAETNVGLVSRDELEETIRNVF